MMKRLTNQSVIFIEELFLIYLRKTSRCMLYIDFLDKLRCHVLNLEKLKGIWSIYSVLSNNKIKN